MESSKTPSLKYDVFVVWGLQCAKDPLSRQGLVIHRGDDLWPVNSLDNVGFNELNGSSLSPEEPIKLAPVLRRWFSSLTLGMCRSPSAAA